MPSNHTENYNLSQWEPGDAVLHTDFNADNLKLDAALARKLGQMELIHLAKTDNKNIASITFMADTVKWEEWSYVCMLVHCSDTYLGPQTFRLTIYNREYQSKEISPLAYPGYMVVFFPGHDLSRLVSGLIFADRFYSFSTDFSYQELLSFALGANDGLQLVCPSVAFFGGR